MSRADARPPGWSRTAWVPPTNYPTGPHRWAIVWTGRANVWMCQTCPATAADVDIRTDCPGWASRPVPL